jgi:catechol 2,3-dioxygenase-like lactoylglutathione lyase family enzyme
MPARPRPGATAASVNGRPTELTEDAVMNVLSSRILLQPSELARSRAFYGDHPGLAVYREFGPPENRGVVYFLGNGLLEVSGHAQQPPVGLEMWLQVRDVAREHERLADAGVTVTRPPRREPWGLVEMWIEDPDGVRIAASEPMVAAAGGLMETTTFGAFDDQHDTVTRSMPAAAEA